MRSLLLKLSTIVDSCLRGFRQMENWNEFSQTLGASGLRNQKAK